MIKNILIFIFLIWILVGTISGILIRKKQREKITINDLFVFGILGLMIPLITIIEDLTHSR